MVNVIVMPKLGLTMEEGVIVKWHKLEGDVVKKGELLFTIETDKATNDMESEVDGVLREIVQKVGKTVKCFEPVAIIADANEDITTVGI